MKRARLFVIILLALLAFIFGNSMLSADASNRFSFWAMGIVLRLFPWLEKFYWMTLHSIIRKCAHIIEFFLLGLLISMLYLQWWRRDKKRCCWIPAAAALLTAYIDELLQLFSPLRHMRLIDVGLDFCSALLGITFVYLIYYLRHRKE